MKKAKTGIVSLGHYIYFQQFEGLYEELKQKEKEFLSYVENEDCEIFDAGYVDCAEGAFDAVKVLHREDIDLLFVLLTTYVPSAVCAPFARYLSSWNRTPHGNS